MGILLLRNLVSQLSGLGISILQVRDLVSQLFDLICDLGDLAGVFTSTVMVTLLASRYDCTAPGAISPDSSADSPEVVLNLTAKDL